ncbi:type II toxin-antitoxin system RelE/ParE family toxin [Chitinophagaceae bacterium MMS25-I14]
MSYRTTLLVKAEKELLNAWHWYEDRQEGLGDRFVNELSLSIERIEQNPEHNSLYKRFYRAARVNIFPYLVIYRINKREKLVIVLSVFHTSRKPSRK